MALRKVIAVWSLMSRKGVRKALADKAESEGWHVVEQVRVEDQPADLVISKSVVVLVRVSAVPVTEAARSDFEVAAEVLGCVGLMLDTHGRELCRAKVGRVMVARPKVVERLLAGEMTVAEVLAAFGLGL